MDAVDEQLAARLVEQARSRGIGLMGPDGLLQQVTKHVLTEIKNRGVDDVCIVVCDGPQGLPDAIATVWLAAVTQTCIVYLLRDSFRYASRRDRAQLAKDLRPI
jgi:putative transposase